jgi:hypothetical protein
MDHGKTDRSEEQIVAEYLARKGVTKCPPGLPRGAPRSGRFNPNASSRLAENVTAGSRRPHPQSRELDCRVGTGSSDAFISSEPALT